MVAGRQGKLSTLDTGLRQRVATGAALLFGLVMFGTAGYVLIEGWSFLDALYMTEIRSLPEAEGFNPQRSMQSP